MANLFRTFLIMVFAGAIVFLGARELQREYSDKMDRSAVEKRKKEMMENLTGKDVRARMSPELAKQEIEKKQEVQSETGAELSWKQYVDEITGEKE